jgi:hypothetical protein
MKLMAYLAVPVDHPGGVVLFDVHKEWQFDNNAQTVAAFK